MKELPSVESVPVKYKLFISKYELKWKPSSSFHSSKAPLKGLLCAFDFGIAQRGYSDFLPWPSMGEKSLSRQMEELKKGEESRRFQITKYNAFLDAAARKEKRSLFCSLQIPPSHFLIDDLSNFKDFERLKDFSRVKVKIRDKEADRIKNLEKALDENRDLKALEKLSQSHSSLKWRLDLNGGSFKDWNLDFLKGKLDFIEDPELSSIEDESLIAEDWLSLKKAPVRIVKPGRDFVLNDRAYLLNKKKVVFTHSFDHPLGQVITAFWAGSFYKSYPSFFTAGGFLDFYLQELKEYPLEKEGCYLKAPSGFGFGFDKSLKKEKWERWI